LGIMKYGEGHSGMSDEQALSTDVRIGQSIVIRTLNDALTLGRVLFESGFFTDIKSASAAVVKVMAGAELGFGPIASMTGVYVQNGRPTFMANLIASAVKRSGYDYKVLTLTSEECHIEFLDKDGSSIGISEFSMQDAINAELTTGRNGHSWKHYKRNMLFSRCMSNGAKWFTPGIFGGVTPYTPEELDMVVDGETGQVIDVPTTGMSVVPDKQENGVTKTRTVNTPNLIVPAPVVEAKAEFPTIEPTDSGKVERKPKPPVITHTRVEPQKAEDKIEMRIRNDETGEAVVVRMNPNANVPPKNVEWFNKQFVGKKELPFESIYHLVGSRGKPGHLQKHFVKANLSELTNSEFAALVGYAYAQIGDDIGYIDPKYYADKIAESVGDAPTAVDPITAESAKTDAVAITEFWNEVAPNVDVATFTQDVFKAAGVSYLTDEQKRRVWDLLEAVKTGAVKPTFDAMTEAVRL